MVLKNRFSVKSVAPSRQIRRLLRDLCQREVKFTACANELMCIISASVLHRY